MDEIYIKIHQAKELAETLKQLEEKILSLPVTAELCEQLSNDVDIIKKIFKDAELKEVNDV